MFLFFDGDTCVEQNDNWIEFALMKELLGVGTDFSQNSRLT